MHGGNACAFELFFKREIEIRRIDTHEHTWAVFKKIARGARAYPQQFRQATQHIRITIDGQFVAGIERPNACRNHARPGDPGRAKLRVMRFKRLHQMRAQQIAGGFTGDDA